MAEQEQPEAPGEAPQPQLTIIEDDWEEAAREPVGRWEGYSLATLNRFFDQC